MNQLTKTISKLSDHQLIAMIEVMMSDDHRVDDKPALYVAAYIEANSRDLLGDDS